MMASQHTSALPWALGPHRDAGPWPAVTGTGCAGWYPRPEYQPLAAGRRSRRRNLIGAGAHAYAGVLASAHTGTAQEHVPGPLAGRPAGGTVTRALPAARGGQVPRQQDLRERSDVDRAPRPVLGPDPNEHAVNLGKLPPDPNRGRAYLRPAGRVGRARRDRPGGRLGLAAGHSVHRAEPVGLPPGRRPGRPGDGEFRDPRRQLRASRPARTSTTSSRRGRGTSASPCSGPRIEDGRRHSSFLKIRPPFMMSFSV
jgi:hypothetical protein